MATDNAEIGAGWWAESVEAVFAIGSQPAVERDARVGPAAAVRMFVGLAGQLADQLAAFGRGEPRVDRLADDAKSQQGRSSRGSALMRTSFKEMAPSNLLRIRPSRADFCWSPTLGRR